ncbi:MAG: NRDE family protein [Alphaproteobacteria bacterium]|nr:NRDE family protein [Alphaproteobacteria bacterium]
MCTVLALIRPGEPWPVLLAANRDELIARPWDPPGAHWPERPGVVAGRDRSAGGSWLGMNRAGLVASVLNRPGSLGPAPGKRSRGELVLDALGHDRAETALGAILALPAGEWRPFNMVLAGRDGAFWLRSEGHGPVTAEPLPPGLSMITAHDRNSADSLRVRAWLPRFATAPAPDPEAGDWSSWRDLLASRAHDGTDGPGGALTIPPRDGYGTICSSLIALPAAAGRAPVWLFAPGPPDRTDYAPVTIA